MVSKQSLMIYNICLDHAIMVRGLFPVHNF